MKSPYALLLAASMAMPVVAAETAAPAKPDVAKGQTLSSQVCGACHTADGSRGSPANPIIAGQHPEYLAKQLGEFKSGKRNNPVMKGFARPWRYGVLHDGRSPFSAAVLKGLRARGEDTGDNAPYSLDPITDFTVPFHAVRRGLNYLELEIRQDLIEHPQGAEAVAGLLAQVFSEALAGLDLA